MGQQRGEGVLAALMRPGMAVMGRLSVGRKLMLVAGLSASVVSVVTWQYFGELGGQIDFSVRERQGIVAVGPMPPAIKAIQLHRGTSQQALAGDAVALAKLPALAADVDTALSGLGEALSASGLGGAAGLPLTERLEELAERWDALKREGASLSRPENFARHTAVVEGLIHWTVDVADASNLTLDPESASYYLMDALVFRLPQAMEHAGRLRGRGAGVLASGAVDDMMRRNLIASDALLGEYAAGLSDVLERAIATGLVDDGVGLPAREANLDRGIAEARAAIEATKMLVGVPQGDAATFFAAMTVPLDAGFATFEPLRIELDRLIADRIERLQARRLVIAFMIGGLVVLTGYLFACAIVGVRRNLQALGDATRALAGGEFLADIAVKGQDEFRDIGDRLLEMSKAMEASLESERFQARENQRIRAALDAADTAVMILSASSRKVLFFNQRMRAIFETNEGVFVNVAPGFRADSLLGEPFDPVWGGEAALASMIEGLRTMAVVDRRFGERRFRISVGPVLDADGKTIGIVFEWVDRTDDLSSAEELEAVLAAAGRGDFSKRVAEAGKTGLFLVQAEALNRLLSVTVRGLDRFGDVMRRVAEGDLTARVDADFEGDLAALKAVVNRSVAELGGIVVAAQSAAEGVDQAAGEIGAGNNELSHRTEEQASTLERAAALTAELASGVRRNLEDTERARVLAEGAADIAGRGAEEIEALTRTMESISESSRRIEAIIGVIDGIAFQTNILALNAAVEAARAGEQGRGFAVVASEVRSLAQRAAGAAREVRELIVASTARVREGSQRAQQTGTNFRELLQAVQSVGSIVNEVARASGQQAGGVRQVDELILGVNTLSQQNAALAEQMNASTEEMVIGSKALSEAIRHIRA